jgi:hypothetical protein
MVNPEIARVYNKKIDVIKKRIKKVIGYPENIPLKEAPMVNKARKIQQWTDFFDGHSNEAKQIHKHSINLLTKYQNFSKLEAPSEEMYDDFFQIANFLDDPQLNNFPPFNQKLIPTSPHYGYGNINPETGHQLLTEYSQDILVASLFSINRKLIGEGISKKLEFEQITAVLETLQNNKHVQIGTGQGKSSVVIPIASIIQSLTSKERGAVVTSVNQNLVKDLQKQTRQLLIKAAQEGFLIPAMTDNGFNYSFEDREIKQRQLIEALTGDGYSHQLVEDLFIKYWGNTFIGQGQQIGEMIKSFLFNQIPKITFVTKDKFVFDLAQGGKEFIDICPHVFFDEVDAPYTMGEVYRTTQENLYIDPKNFLDSAARYAFNQIVLSQLDLSSDWELSLGENPTLKPEKENSLIQINFQEIINSQSGDSPFKKAIKIIGNSLGLDNAQVMGIEEKVKKYLLENIEQIKYQTTPDNPNPFGDYAADVANYLIRAFYTLNKSYLIEGENIIIRSEYFDQLLESHQFDPDTQLAILALTNRFKTVNLSPKTAQTFKFPTIITQLGNKLHGFSATLKETDLITEKVKNSRFANFLKAATGKEVFEITPPEWKKAPPPTIIESPDEIENKLNEIINNQGLSKPVLILSHYDINKTKKIFSRLQNLFPNQADIKLLPSLPSQQDKLESYYQEVKKSCQSLAEGKLKIIVSTGNLGTGANIVKATNEFPDLKIGILGLPESETLLRQELGRRRAIGSESFWIIDKDSLKKLATRLSYQENVLIRANLTPDKALKIINVLEEKKPEEIRRFVIRLIHEASLSRLENDDNIVGYDLLFKNGIIPEAERIMKKRILESYFDNKDEKELTDEEKNKLLIFIDLFGLPDYLYDRLTSLENMSNLQAQTGRYAEVADKLTTRLVKDRILPDLINDWFDNSQSSITTIYHDIFKDGENNVIPIVISTTPIKPEEIGKKITYHGIDNNQDAQLVRVRIKNKYRSGFVIGDQTYLIQGTVKWRDLKKIQAIYEHQDQGFSVKFVLIKK